MHAVAIFAVRRCRQKGAPVYPLLLPLFPLEGLPTAPCASQLLFEHRCVLWRQAEEARYDLLGAPLRHDDEAQARDAPRPCRWRPKPLSIGACPPPQQVLLQDLGLGLVAQVLNDREGAEEGSQNSLWEVQNELFAPLQRIRLRASEVGEPVHEIKRNILGVGLPRQHNALKPGKQCPRRGFGLDQPPHVVFHLALCEFDTSPLRQGQHREGRQSFGHVLEHIAQRSIVVTNLLPDLIAVPWPPALLDHRAQGADLHDVVDRGEHQHRQGPVDVVAKVRRHLPLWGRAWTRRGRQGRARRRHEA
mmetsp:Transcript_78381/g.227481  ORF Transcript_78381/g.227481 Transcript_78381/m.227481 type:complete len:304 (+) Transcript_78381:862-1773(+)